MMRLPPESTLTDALFPYWTLVISQKRFSMSPNCASEDQVETVLSHPVVPCIDIPWRFDPSAKGQLDEPFRALVTMAGKRVVADLVEIVLDVPKQAAIHASKVFKQYAQIGRAHV